MIISNMWENCSKLLVLNVFWPEHLLLDRCFSFKTEDLVFIWSCPEGLYKSCKFGGQISLKNSKALEQMHWLNLSETGSQFICSNSFIPMWLLLFSWRQNLIHMFCIVWQFAFKFFVQVWIPSWTGIIEMWLNYSIA